MDFEYYFDRYVEGVIQISLFGLLVALLLPVMSDLVFVAAILITPIIWRGSERGLTYIVRKRL